MFGKSRLKQNWEIYLCKIRFGNNNAFPFQLLLYSWLNIFPKYHMEGLNYNYTVAFLKGVRTSIEDCLVLDRILLIC